MIIDTSALIAVLINEAGSDALVDAIVAQRGGIPAPAMVEFVRVASNQRFGLRNEAEDLLAKLERRGCATVAFTQDHARIANEAEPLYGSGNGNGGPLNLLDLMVYAVAKERGEPLLCTGKDFAATDIELHPASRPF
ncbi:MAG: VapC toxin family PIN domain ribonuclease [Stutzerimonas stutzeri]|nr:MAG: VapC toxin family PIN domain ribonuclease [Stutzerimonas stutzeri]